MGCHCGPGGIAVEQSRIAAHADPSMGLAGSIDAHQVDLIREVFRYARRFAGKRFVFQISSAIIDSDGFPALVKDLAILHQSGIGIILVPGASMGIDRLLKKFDRESEFANGIRISTADSLPIIKMAAFDAANRLMTELSSQQVSSVIGNWVRARAIGVVDGVDYHMTGEAEKISFAQLERILADNLIPILPCIGWNIPGQAYNISSIELASQLATGLGADKLFFISGDFDLRAEAYSVDLENSVVLDGRLSRFTVQDARLFVESNRGTLPPHWRDILVHATEAARLGVPRAHILDGRSDGAVLREIFSSRGSGTMIHADPFESIRPMVNEDISDVLRLMAPGIESGQLIPRSRIDLQAAVDQFAVFETDGAVRGCGALIGSEQNRGEIAGMAVDPEYSHLGIGNKILRYLIEQAREKGMTGLYALTTRASDWFQNNGFERGAVSDLPEDKRSRYNEERNSRVFVLRLG
jgi:amino-acid N-acetyltransferase